MRFSRGSITIETAKAGRQIAHAKRRVPAAVPAARQSRSPDAETAAGADTGPPVAYRFARHKQLANVAEVAERQEVALNGRRQRTVG